MCSVYVNRGVYGYLVAREEEYSRDGLSAKDPDPHSKFPGAKELAFPAPQGWAL